MTAHSVSPAVAVHLDGTGWHPASWSEPGADPTGVTSPEHWLALVSPLDRAGAALVSFGDRFGLPAGPLAGVVGRVDPLLLSARLAPVTDRIALVPTVLTGATEPFHISKAVATLDIVAHGRAGVLPRWSTDDGEIAIAGRDASATPTTADRREEAADHVEVQRRLWDSWEDDAVIRDVATGRFVDVDKLHPINFEGRFFSVRGASITPRPPQGQPPVALTVTGRDDLAVAVSAADLVFLDPQDGSDPDELLTELAALAAAAGRTTPLLPFLDVRVAVDTPTETGAERLARLDRISPADGRRPVLTGSPGTVAAAIVEITARGFAGVRLLPAVHAVDVPLLAEIVPTLGPVAEGDLRTRLGLDRPANRYAIEGVSA